MQSTRSSLFTAQLSLPFYCIQFAPESYNESSFPDYGIAQPNHLQRAVGKRKAEYLAGRICAQHCLVQLGHPDFTVHSGEDRAPIWPPTVRASITHTRGIAAAIATTDKAIKGVGIDIERDMAAKQERELQRQLLHPQEYDLFTRLGKHHHNPLTLIFSAKESIYKALYSTVQCFFGFDAVKLIDFNDHQLQYTVMTPLHQSIQPGTSLTVYYQCVEGLVLTECEYRGK